MSEMTTIQVSRVVKDKIATLGSKGETYNRILDRILNMIPPKETKKT